MQVMKTGPRRLRFDPYTVVDAPFQVLENAFWRPQAAKLAAKHRESIAETSKPGTKTYELLRAAWRREETWINHALNALLASMPDDMLARFLGDQCGGTRLDASQVSMMDSGGMASLTGAPDFIVMGTRTCVLGESKVAAHSASHRYSFGQFTKYQMLGAMLTCARDPKMRRNVVHLILSPEPHPEHFSSDWDQWRPDVEGARMRIDARKLALRDPKGRFRDFSSWRAFVRETLLDARVNTRCELDREQVEALMRCDSPALIPTYIATWGQAMSAVRTLAQAQGFSSLTLAASKLEQAAYGPEGDRSDKFVAKNVVWLE
jgi:hypothetical protein